MTYYSSHSIFQDHEGPNSHPECPGRVLAIEKRLRAHDIYDQLTHFEALAATLEQVGRVHSTQLIESLHEASPSSGLAYLDPDTFMNPSSLEAALFAAGAAVQATEHVVAGKTNNAFCAVRPPGHHAERNQAMGFCLINNVAVAAAHALESLGLERVAILDFDVHHGNGTEDIFANDERVLFCSTFQHPFYPSRGGGNDIANCINVPLPGGTHSARFRQAVTDYWTDPIMQFEPQMIFISAGFDGHREDTLASFELIDDDYVWITEYIMKLAQQSANGKIVSCLEGGYALDALARSVSLHIRTLAEL